MHQSVIRISLFSFMVTITGCASLEERRTQLASQIANEFQVPIQNLNAVICNFAKIKKNVRYKDDVLPQFYWGVCAIDKENGDYYFYPQNKQAIEHVFLPIDFSDYEKNRTKSKSFLQIKTIDDFSITYFTIGMFKREVNQLTIDGLGDRYIMNLPKDESTQFVNLLKKFKIKQASRSNMYSEQVDPLVIDSPRKK